MGVPRSASTSGVRFIRVGRGASAIAVDQDAEIMRVRRYFVARMRVTLDDVDEVFGPHSGGAIVVVRANKHRVPRIHLYAVRRREHHVRGYNDARAATVDAVAFGDDENGGDVHVIRCAACDRLHRLADGIDGRRRPAARQRRRSTVPSPKRVRIAIARHSGSESAQRKGSVSDISRSHFRRSAGGGNPACPSARASALGDA